MNIQTCCKCGNEVECSFTTIAGSPVCRTCVETTDVKVQEADVSILFGNS